jgi:hypothetical protein
MAAPASPCCAIGFFSDEATYRHHQKCDRAVRCTVPVKRAYWPGPVTLLAIAGLGGTVACGFSSSLPVCAIVQAVSSWSARSRAAARTNELDAGKRWPIIEGEEEPAGGWRMRKGDLAAPVRGWVGVVSHAPIRHLPGGGVLSQIIERGGAGSCDNASSPGAWRPLRVGEQVVGAGE